MVYSDTIPESWLQLRCNTGAYNRQRNVPIPSCLDRESRRAFNPCLTLASLLAWLGTDERCDIARNRAITVGNLANRIPICVPIEPRHCISCGRTSVNLQIVRARRKPWHGLPINYIPRFTWYLFFERIESANSNTRRWRFRNSMFNV